MALNFPSNPTVNQVYQSGTTDWIFDGAVWAPVAIETITDTPTAGEMKKAITSNWAYDHIINLHKANSSIGVAGRQGFGVGLYPTSLPTGFSEIAGTSDQASDNYGNYQYIDGSIMCWIPKFYYRIGSVSSPNYAVYGVNAIDIASSYDFADETAANAGGYALHRAFKNGGLVKNGFMADKYQCSNFNNVASSVKNGNPLSSSSSHNGFSTLTGTPANYYYGALDAAKTRGAQFHCMSRFQFAALALLATAHGQAATSATYCAWYNAALTTNFPKGNNNNALKDVNDTAVTWESDGYPNCGKTGSAGFGGGAGNVFAKSTHNGQNCGIADLNGNMWEINTGLTRPGSSASDTTEQNNAAAFYVLKESVDINTLTSGWSSTASGNEAWGTETHLATLYDTITLAQVSNVGTASRFGNGANQVLAGDTSGANYLQTGLGFPTALGKSAGGSNLFGQDYFYELHRANLCLISGGHWGNDTAAGVWNVYLHLFRADSNDALGFRSAAYV